MGAKLANEVISTHKAVFHTFTDAQQQKQTDAVQLSDRGPEDRQTNVDRV